MPANVRFCRFGHSKHHIRRIIDRFRRIRQTTSRFCMDSESRVERKTF
ncbi:hypothetical protein BIFCAT_01683 [Bifidobacterium catenulatum DSM 16992 = JCM 1194 = LMG 11043]|uniref:Uncharacterized protein n=1 Tax=Bifidobacterium catenulatum DSM 16992 = JCM 1194 = LMG 11043 TaxID=566552 RepID=B6XWM2_9BIFI|nr:hypothetical protein BIFCAT_01683 [Bifidobacterium catenulatum DSM 16992 = JCM 1194 = LMG 11043]